MAARSRARCASSWLSRTHDDTPEPTTSPVAAWSSRCRAAIRVTPAGRRYRRIVAETPSRAVTASTTTLRRRADSLAVWTLRWPGSRRRRIRRRAPATSPGARTTTASNMTPDRSLSSVNAHTGQTLLPVRPAAGRGGSRGGSRTHRGWAAKRDSSRHGRRPLPCASELRRHHPTRANPTSNPMPDSSGPQGAQSRLPALWRRPAGHPRPRHRHETDRL